MDNTVIMHVRDGTDNGGSDAGRLLLRVGIPRVEVASFAALHDHIQLAAIIKGFHDAHNVGMIEHFQEGDFVFEFVNEGGVPNVFVVNRFHGKNQVAVASGGRRDVGKRRDAGGFGRRGDIAGMQRCLFHERVRLGLETGFEESADQRQREARLHLLLHFATFLHVVPRTSTNHRVALAHHGDGSHASFAQQFGDLVVGQRIATGVRPGQIAAQTRTRKPVSATATAVAVRARAIVCAPRTALAHADAAGGAVILWDRQDFVRRWGREIDVGRHGATCMLGWLAGLMEMV